MAAVTPDLVQSYAEKDALGLAEWVRDKEVTELIETADPNWSRRSTASSTPSSSAPSTSRARRARGRGGPLRRRALPPQEYRLDVAGHAAHQRPRLFRKLASAASALTQRIKAAGFGLLGRSNTPNAAGASPPSRGSQARPSIPGIPAVTPGGSSGGAAAAAPRSARSPKPPTAALDLRAGLLLRPRRAEALARAHHLRPDTVDIWHGSIAIFYCPTVRDMAAYLDAVAGHRSATLILWRGPEGSWLAGLSEPARRLRIGYVSTAAWGEAPAPANHGGAWTRRPAICATSAMMSRSIGSASISRPRGNTTMWSTWSRPPPISVGSLLLIGCEAVESDFAPVNRSSSGSGARARRCNIPVSSPAVRKVDPKYFPRPLAL